jgi:conjugative relaxase-like TrwC/TraI family protein
VNNYVKGSVLMAVSIAGVTAAQALTYYERRDEGYYHTEGNGEIIGKGAEALNISGQVETTVFGRLLLGQNSLGEQIIKLAPNGEHRAALDLTFSAPKSLSLLAYQTRDFS